MNAHVKTGCILTALGLAVSLGAPRSASALEETACRLYGTSLADDYLNPPTAGDKDFFTSSGAVPNVIFVLDTSGSMDYSIVWPDSYGCNDSDMSRVYSGYDPSAPDAPFDPDHSSYKFEKDKWYGGNYDSDNPPTPGDSKWSRDEICNYEYSAHEQECRDCFAGAGYWRSYRTGRRYFRGHLLNYQPLERWVVARRVIKDVVKDVKRVRMGLAIYDNGSSISDGAKWFQNNSLNPSCDMPTTSAFDNNRSSILNAIDNHYDRDLCSGNTPLANALFDVGAYYAERSAALYDHWFGSGYTESDFTESSSDNQRSICASCQFSSVVLITDGEPNEDNDVLPSQIRNLTSGNNPDVVCKYLSSSHCEDEALHKVAWWLQNHDFRPSYSGEQRVTTYTVGFMLDSDLLKEAAYQGDGFYVSASNATQLKDGIMAIMDDVVRRGLAFTSSSFNPVQAQATQSILAPRFIPNSNSPWTGQLFRFDFISEFVVDVDLNGDSDKEDSFIVDKGCESVDWDAVAAGGTIPAACRPLRVNPSDGLLYRQASWTNPTLNDLAVPFWEAGQKLLDEGASNRRIFTAIDSNGDGNIDAADDVVAFTEANVSSLLPYFGLDGNDICTQIAIRENVAFNSDEDCGRWIIRFVRGRTVTDSKDRETILGDIFHSSPVIVEPPVPYTSLGLGWDAQSLWTLGKVDEFVGDNGTENPYGVFAAAHRTRDRVALVGANDGMLHAFRVGQCDENCASDAVLAPVYDRGDGKELWAFIPPDLLPKLKFRLLGEHHYYVDGTPWVRNIWVDANGDYKRTDDEYHTIAVIGEREGGNFWSALDVTDLGASDYEPKLLWTYPEISSARIVESGQSWSDITPIPPPIGPIRYYDDQAPEDAPEYMGKAFMEKWIVALPGGYDGNQVHGRGFYFVDAWTGETLWDFSFDKDDPIKQHLNYSIAAVPALTSWGDKEIVDQMQVRDGYFKTMVVGDTGGQVWTARFQDPDPDKWAAGRMFQEAKTDDRVAFRNPFFQIAWFAPLEREGYLRANLGTGNRAQLRDNGGGRCSLENLAACARDGCKVKMDSKVHIGGDKADIKWEIKDDGTLGKDKTKVHDGDHACDKLEVSMKVEMKNCPGLVNNNDTDGDTTLDSWKGEAKLKCDTGTGDYKCESKEKQTSDLEMTCVDPADWRRNRFYSIRVFGGGDQQPFNDAAGAADYDDARLTDGTGTSDVRDADTYDQSGMSAGWYHEYPVIQERTATPSLVAGRCVIWSTLETSPVSCQTGTVTSQTSTSTNSDEERYCGGSSDTNAWMYFRNVSTGKPDCLDMVPGASTWDSGNYRKDLGSEPQPPPPPQVVVQVSKEGKTQASVPDADGDSITVGSGDTILQSFGTVEVPPDLHDVRHAACDSDETSCQ